MRIGQLAFDVFIIHDPARRGVDEQHAPRAQPILADDALFRNGQDAHLRRDHDAVIVSDAVARGTQAIAVKHGADDDAVGERDGRRSVPGLHERRVVLIERAHRRIHVFAIRPRLGNHHQHRMRQRSAGHDQQFEHVVERCRITATSADDGKDFPKVVTKDGGGQALFTRMHPIGVAAHGVDFTVVGYVTVGMGERPRGKRVGRKALMHQRER